MQQTADAVQYRCESCGAPVTWNPEAGALACEYCGGTRPVEIPPHEIVEHAIAQAFAHPERKGLDRPVRRLRCETCGAAVQLDPGVVAGRCAFCGAATVAEVEGESTLWRPESLLPFAVGRDDAVARYRRWLAHLWFRPSDLKKRAALDDVAGVYLPFWTFDARAASWWSAEAGYHYYVTERYTDAEGNEKTRQVQHTRWEPASGRHAAFYDDVLVYASKGLPRSLCEKIEPFPTKSVVPYEAEYLAGFGAEEYAIDPKAGFEIGKKRIFDAERAACEAMVPGDTHRSFRWKSNLSDATFKHVLLPVWIAAYRYKDESYRFLVNGQTGEVQGQAPYSWAKITLTVLAVLAAVALLVLLAR